MSLPPDVARMKRELADLVAIDTQNPPGDEARAAQFLGYHPRAQLLADAYFLGGRVDLGSLREGLLQPLIHNVFILDVVVAEDRPANQKAHQQRAAGIPTIPSRLGDEKRANPFLLAKDVAALADRTARLCGRPKLPAIFDLRSIA